MYFVCHGSLIRISRLLEMETDSNLFYARRTCSQIKGMIRRCSRKSHCFSQHPLNHSPVAEIPNRRMFSFLRFLSFCKESLTSSLVFIWEFTCSRNGSRSLSVTFRFEFMIFSYFIYLQKRFLFLFCLYSGHVI